MKTLINIFNFFLILFLFIGNTFANSAADLKVSIQGQAIENLKDAPKTDLSPYRPYSDEEILELKKTIIAQLRIFFPLLKSFSDEEIVKIFRVNFQVLEYFEKAYFVIFQISIADGPLMNPYYASYYTIHKYADYYGRDQSKKDNITRGSVGSFQMGDLHPLDVVPYSKSLALTSERFLWQALHDAVGRAWRFSWKKRELSLISTRVQDWILANKTLPKDLKDKLINLKEQKIRTEIDKLETELQRKEEN